MDLIAWTDFDWTSFSTLAAGFMAVAGAVVIGMRQLALNQAQLKITAQQVLLIERQTDLQELTLRHDLYDRRYAIYEAAKNLLGYIIAHAEPPPYELQGKFQMAMIEAKLLFGPAVQAGLDDIWTRVGDYHVLKAEMSSNYRRDGHYGHGNPGREADLFKVLVDHWQGLTDLIGDEMRLTSDLGSARRSEAAKQDEVA